MYRATLSTGKPVLGSTLERLDVAGGEIDFSGYGLNGAGLNTLDLVAGSLKVNAPIALEGAHSNLYAVLGANQVSYATLASVPMTRVGASPTFAIDVGPGGAMYANQIYLVATEQGLGVRHAGFIQATGGGFTLDASGDLTLNGTIRAGAGQLPPSTPPTPEPVDPPAPPCIPHAGQPCGDIPKTMPMSPDIVAVPVPAAPANVAMVLSARNIAGTSASLSSTGLTLLQASGTLNLGAATIAASDVMLASGGALTLVQPDIKASGDIRLNSGNEMTVQAGTFKADGLAAFSAAGDLALQSVASTSHVVDGLTTRDFTRFARTQVDAGGTVSLQSSGGIVTLDGSQVQSGASIAVQGTGVAVLARKDLTKETTLLSNTTLMPTSENLVQARLLAEGDIALLASGTGADQGKLFITGAKIESANGHVSLLASKDVDIAHDVTTDTTYEHFYEVKRGWFSKKVTDNVKTSSQETANPSDISGRSVSIGAGGKLGIVGSLVMADGAIGLHADQDLSLLSTAEASYAFESRSVTKSGIFGNGGLSITIGSKSHTDITQAQDARQASTSIASLAGDVLATAGGNYLQMSSDITAPQGDVHIAAQNITLASNNNTRSVLNIIRDRQSGLTLSATHPLVAAAQSVEEMARIARRTDNGRYRAMALLTSGLTIYNQWRPLDEITKSLTSVTGDAANAGWTFSASLGSSHSDFESLIGTTTPVESAINAGRNVSLTATTGDITLVGSRVIASQDLAVTAARDLTLSAAIGKSTEDTKRSSSSGAVGLAYTAGGNSAGLHLTLAASRSNAWSNGWGTTYFNSELTAGQQLAMDVGSDAVLSGAKASGETVRARIGTSGSGNLTIASPLDESHYQAREETFGFNASIPIPGLGVGGSFNLNASQLKLLAENESVKQQSSITAGTGGFDIRVNGNTQLKGGAVASKASGADANVFETQTLSHEDVVNRDVASGKSWSVGLAFGGGLDSKGSAALSSIGFARIDSNEHFTTQSSIAGGVHITRADLQAGIAAQLRAGERDPLAAARVQRASDLDLLMVSEPPKCVGCSLEGLPAVPVTVPPAPSANTRIGRIPTPVQGPDVLQLSGTGTASPSLFFPGPALPTDPDPLHINPAWLAWNEALLKATHDIASLDARIAAIDAKVYAGPATLSISPNALHQPLLYTFDKARATQDLKDGVAVTAAFGKAAFQAAGTFSAQQAKAAQDVCGKGQPCPDADKWRDGGAYKVLLHAVVGAVSNGSAGAVAALTAEAATPYIKTALIAAGLAEGSVAYDLLMLGAKTMIGSGVGGTAGAAVAFNADANNRQLHPTEIQIIRQQAANFARQLNGGAQPTHGEIDAAETRLAQEAFRIVQFGAPGASDSVANAFLHQPQFKIQLPPDPNQLEMGVGYAFYATPQQRANPNMYADLIVSEPSALSFYWKNGIRQPSLAEMASAIERYNLGRDNTTLLTKLAALFSGGAALAPSAPTAMVACLANIAQCGIAAAEIAAGPAAGPGLGFTYLASRAGVNKVVTAAQANAEWMALRPTNTAAWSEGSVILKGEISVGTRMQMYVTKEQAEGLSKGELNNLGGWATFDARPESVFQLRQDLALPQAFKPTDKGLFVIELEVTKAMPANVGFVGPQSGGPGQSARYLGGGTQIQFTDYSNRTSFVKLVGIPKCVEGC